MPKEVPAFLWAETADNLSNPADKTGNGALGCLTQMRFEFAESRLDWIEVWRICRQINQTRACRFDGLLDTRNLVDAGIVYKNGGAALEDGDNAFFYVGNKHRAVHGPFKYKRRYHCALPQPSDEGNDFPVSLRCIADQPLSARTATA